MFLRFNASKGWSNIAGIDEEEKRPSSVVPAVTRSERRTKPRHEEKSIWQSMEYKQEGLVGHDFLLTVKRNCCLVVDAAETQLAGEKP